ncbi:MAG: response regulator, partial [Vallitaleaceae bacterium]|nr:response regulator [Vallitaleaceae bacterium]
MYKAMIVDDEQLTLSFLKTIIPKLSPKWQVISEASDGEQACSLLASGHYDLVITDIKMPIMDGVTLCETIHRDFPHIITVILSGYGEFEYAKKAIQYGVSNYLLKPIVNSELQVILNEIATILDQKEASNLEYLRLVQLSSKYKEDIATNLLQAIVSQAHIQIKSLFPLLYQLDINLMDEEGVILILQQSYVASPSKSASINITLTKLLIYKTALLALKGTTSSIFLDTGGNTLV